MASIGSLKALNLATKNKKTKYFKDSSTKAAAKNASNKFIKLILLKLLK